MISADVYTAVALQLGFLNLNLPECAGNMGLKDQLIAFQWVKRNIEYFGGDPNNITLFGQSAGASSIHLHMMSPLSDGLFHKCVLQSGSALSTWSFSDTLEERAFELGRLLGFEGDDKQKLLEFLKCAHVRDLCMANETLRSELKQRYPGKSTTYPFLPSVERFSQTAMLLDHPEKLLKNTRKLPVIVGMNDKEGGNMFVKEPNIIEILNTQFDNVIKTNYENEQIDEEAIRELKNYYFPNGTVSAENKNSVIDMYTDFYFKHFYDLEEHLVQDPDAVPVYTYQFCYDGSVNLFKYFFGNFIGNVDGAIHADDHFYLFGSNIFFKNPTFRFTKDDVRVTDYLCTMWTNFAKTGDPNSDRVPVTWHPTTKDKRCYLRIDKHLEMKDGAINQQRYRFWQNLRSKVEPSVSSSQLSSSSSY